MGLLAGGGLTARVLPAGALVAGALVLHALDAGAYDFAAERGESRPWVKAPIRAPAIARLRPALAALPLPSIEQNLHSAGAGERPREVVVERRLPARHEDEEPAPLGHKNDLNRL